MRRATRSRRSLRRRTWWTSARPSSHGAPTCLIEDSGEAPVPPACPDRWMYDAPAFATPAAMVPDTSARDELDADPRRRVDRPQVGDQLGQVLDRVDVVMRRRADVALAGLAATKGGDVRGRLPAGELAALARLRTLGDLDLELVGAREVGRGHAEPRRSDLLDAGIAPLTVRPGRVPGRVLPTLAGVRGPARQLDADGQGLVRLRTQGADAHRRHDEPPDDRGRVLDVAEIDADRRRTDPQLIARDGVVGRRPRERSPVACERVVDGDRRIGRGGPVRLRAVRGEDLDLSRDAR